MDVIKRANLDQVHEEDFELVKDTLTEINQMELLTAFFQMGITILLP